MDTSLEFDPYDRIEDELHQQDVMEAKYLKVQQTIRLLQLKLEDTQIRHDRAARAGKRPWCYSHRMTASILTALLGKYHDYANDLRDRHEMSRDNVFRYDDIIDEYGL